MCHEANNRATLELADSGCSTKDHRLGERLVDLLQEVRRVWQRVALNAGEGATSVAGTRKRSTILLMYDVWCNLIEPASSR